MEPDARETGGDSVSEPESSLDRDVRKRQERIDEFAKFGIKGTKGPHLHAVHFGAADLDKLLRALRCAAKAKKVKS